MREVISAVGRVYPNSKTLWVMRIYYVVHVSSCVHHSFGSMEEDKYGESVPRLQLVPSMHRYGLHMITIRHERKGTNNRCTIHAQHIPGKSPKRIGVVLRPAAK